MRLEFHYLLHWYSLFTSVGLPNKRVYWESMWSCSTARRWFIQSDASLQKHKWTFTGKDSYPYLLLPPFFMTPIITHDVTIRGCLKQQKNSRKLVHLSMKWIFPHSSILLHVTKNRIFIYQKCLDLFYRSSWSPFISIVQVQYQICCQSEWRSWGHNDG